jgi:hypothetical protein
LRSIINIPSIAGLKTFDHDSAQKFGYFTTEATIAFRTKETAAEYAGFETKKKSKLIQEARIW